MTMLQKLKQGIFPFLIGFSALSVSASAAFYSVSGLSKLFAGASLEVIIMASSLEFAKLVTASLLYQYWDTINKTLKIYLSVATIILVLITSMGIYGFLSAAYQETYSKLSIKENQTKFLTQKKDFYESDLARYNKELEIIGTNINNLSTAKSSQIQVRDTSSSTGFRTTISTTELRMAQKRIEVEEENRKKIQSKREVVADSLQKYQLKILELDNNTEVAGELGPLQYLSSLTGYSMDKIINILLLIIIFVFDPLAISLVIASNFAFEKAYPKKKYRKNLYGEKEEIGASLEVQSKYTDWDVTLQDGLEDEEWDEDHALDLVLNDIVSDEKVLNELNNIEVKDAEVVEPEYDILDLNQDGIVDENEIDIAKNRIQQLKNQLKQSLSGWRIKKIQNELKQLENRFKSDDETKTY